MRRGILVAVIVLSLIVPITTISCDAIQESEAEAVIGSEGGVVEVTEPSSELFGTRVVIPEGALPSDAEVSIISVDIDPSVYGNETETAALPGFRIDMPDNQLEIPATIEVPVTDSEGDGILDGTDFLITSLSMYRSIDDTSGEYERIGTYYDTQRQVLVAQTDRFSSWLIFAHRWTQGIVWYLLEDVPSNEYYSDNSMREEVSQAFAMWSEALDGNLVFIEVPSHFTQIKLHISVSDTPVEHLASTTHHLSPLSTRHITLFRNGIDGTPRLWVSGDYTLPPPDKGDYEYIPFLRVLMNQISHALGVSYDPEEGFSCNPVYGPYDIVRQDIVTSHIWPWGAVPLTRLSGFDIEEIRKHYELEPFEVSFPDTNLEDAIRAVIDKPSAPIYLDDLKSLVVQEGEFNYWGITDLTGLQYCTNLEVLGLYYNDISDISILSSLSNLKHLNLLANEIVDITPLSFLGRLEALKLEENQIVDIAPVSFLTKLKSLNVNKNQVVDIEPIGSLTNLQFLHLGNNQISDITPLSSLTDLTSLYLFGNQIADIESIDSLTNLISLNLYDNQITDISPLGTLTKIRELGLSSNQIVDIEPLISLDNLVSVYLQDNPLSSQSINVYIPILLGKGVYVVW